jgi:protein SCO1/2
MRKQKMPILVGVFVAFLIATLTMATLMLEKSESPATSADEAAFRLPHAPPGSPLPVLWDAPAFSYIDQNGRPFTSDNLRGRVWITDFFFTTCTSICPMMTLRMSQLQTLLAATDVQLVSFSVDPDHDTPPVLMEYAKAWKADETRWHFLSTDPKHLLETAAGMKVFVQLPDKDTPIQHSGLFTLVDANGKVRGVYDSSDQEALHRLAGDALALAGVPNAQAASSQAQWIDPAAGIKVDTPGAALYLACGCVACHSQGRVAPSLSGLYGSEVHFDDGRTLLADESYLRKSLLDPDALRVAGYPRLMPGYRAQLSDAEIDQVVQYIKSLANDAPATQPGQASSNGVAQAIDPVCKMAVPAIDATIHLDYQGTRYYFCSETCRRLFLLAPAKFTGHQNLPAAP